MPAMSKMVRMDEVDSIEFKWGTRRGRGGTKKDFQFYESFTYDGVKYSLYDSVYLYKDGEPDPYIGKLIKIWESPSKFKKVKVLWFFRPSEISNYLRGVETLKNELFLGTGVGIDGSGLENINPLEAIAGKCNVVCISKDARNRQPSLEELKTADYVFYRTFDVDKFTISDKLEESISKVEVRLLLNNDDSHLLRIGSSNEGHSHSSDATAEEGTVLQKKDTSKTLEPVSKSGAVTMEGDPAAQYSVDTRQHSSVANSGGPYVAKVEPPAKDNVCVEKTVVSKHVEAQINSSPRKSSNTSHLKLENEADTQNCSGKIKEAITEKAAAFGINGLKNSLSPSSVDDQKFETEFSKTEKLSYGGDLGSLDGRPSKKLKSDDSSESALKLAVNANRSNLKELSKPVVVSNEKQKHEDDKDSHGHFKVKSPVKSADDSLDDRPSKKLKFAEPLMTTSMQNLGSASAGAKSKAPLSSAPAGDSKSKRLIKDCSGANACLSKKKINGEKKLPDGKSHVASSKQISKKDTKVYGQVVEVTRRPDTDSSRWFTGLPWEDTMKGAPEEGRLVLLQNLDPTYTSLEVEDIVWHSFRENCTAKVLHCTSISGSHYGQAFVIFRTKQAAARAVQQLEEGCLMLPNGRPLLGHGVAHLPGKSSSFPGHLFIDRLKFAMQKDKREAVATSHSSQPNTLEYDMAMEWRVLQERTDFMWKNLLKKQGEELKRLRASLKRKL